MSSSRADRDFLEMLRRLATAMDGHFIHTHGRSSRIATYCSLMADHLGLTGQERHDLELASFAHDLGMLGVPAEIPRKKGRLTPTEFALVQQHPSIGAEILSAMPQCAGAVPLVRHHHEHWDGSGYPQGLAEEAIPLGATVIAVAEAVDAMTHSRPYRQHSSLAAAARLIQQGSGSQFAPQAAEALASVMDRVQASMALEAPASTSRRLHRQPPG